MASFALGTNAYYVGDIVDVRLRNQIDGTFGENWRRGIVVDVYESVRGDLINHLPGNSDEYAWLLEHGEKTLAIAVSWLPSDGDCDFGWEALQPGIDGEAKVIKRAFYVEL